MRIRNHEYMIQTLQDWYTVSKHKETNTECIGNVPQPLPVQGRI